MSLIFFNDPQGTPSQMYSILLRFCKNLDYFKVIDNTHRSKNYPLAKLTSPLMSAIFDFSSLLTVILLLICTCAYLRDMRPTIFDGGKVRPAL
jgi:hypothetical protein